MRTNGSVCVRCAGNIRNEGTVGRGFGGASPARLRTPFRLLDVRRIPISPIRTTLHVLISTYACLRTGMDTEKRRNDGTFAPDTMLKPDPSPARRRRFNLGRERHPYGIDPSGMTTSPHSITLTSTDAFPVATGFSIDPDQREESRADPARQYNFVAGENAIWYLHHRSVSSCPNA